MDEQQAEAYLDSEDYQEQMDQQEEMSDWSEAQVPQTKKADTLFSLFQKVWKTPDSSKVANLKNAELGKLDFSVRDAQYLALLGMMLNHKNFATFFKTSSEIILSTSASRNGWFTELFVSQKKYTQRAASVNTPTSAQSASKKWSLFGGQSTTVDSSQ